MRKFLLKQLAALCGAVKVKLGGGAAVNEILKLHADCNGPLKKSIAATLQRHMYKQSLIVSGAERGGRGAGAAKPITVLALTFDAAAPTHIFNSNQFDRTYLYIEVPCFYCSLHRVTAANIARPPPASIEIAIPFLYFDFDFFPVLRVAPVLFRLIFIAQGGRATNRNSRYVQFKIV